MPVTSLSSPSTDFSYEANVAPYSRSSANRFFGEIGADPNLRAADKAQLQGTLLQGVTDIATQREKLQQEAQQSVMGRLRIQEAESALEESRLRRQRIAQAEADDNDLAGQINGVVYADASPEERQQALADLELQHSGKLAYNPILKQRFNAAKGAIPKSPKAMFTPDKMVDLYSKLPPEIAGSGDPALIGQSLAIVGQAEEQHKAALAEMKADTAESRRLRHALLTVDPKFEKDETTGEERWLDTGVHNQFKLLMEIEGTPEEQKKFNAEQDDKKRAIMAQQVQLRARRAAVAGGQKQGPSPKDVARSLVGAPR